MLLPVITLPAAGVIWAFGNSLDHASLFRVRPKGEAAKNDATGSETSQTTVEPSGKRVLAASRDFSFAKSHVGDPHTILSDLAAPPPS